jgi:phosphohistidine phosphatase
MWRWGGGRGPTCDDAQVRRLVLVRHAKSSWDDLSLTDRQRPLAPRGIAALGPMRDHLAAGDGRPDLVLCSPARRTRLTLEGIRAALPEHVRIETIDELYGADAWQLLRLVRSSDDEYSGVMVVGHNPGLGDLAVLLAGSGDPEARGQLRAKFPTGAMATISFDGRWSEVAPGSGRLDALFTPRRPRP